LIAEPRQAILPRIEDRSLIISKAMPDLFSVEICAGAGGQALGVEQAGFNHVLAVELDPTAHATLVENRPEWNPRLADVRDLNGREFRNIDLFAGGVPCPPFSIAGKQLGADDERDLFPTALRIIEQARPRAIMLENVRGILGARFFEYRRSILAHLERLGYLADWKVVNASDFGVPQLRPRSVLVAMQPKDFARFSWPEEILSPPTVGEVLLPMMASRDWPGASMWRACANGIAPTLVGGSKKHGGPDLGPTRAKLAWRQLHVDAHGLADAPPGHDFPFDGHPKLTVPMAARLQGFPPDWTFVGKKTATYRQVGNAFPPPVAYGVSKAIAAAMLGRAARKARAENLALFAGSSG
jgi:DNA (cytosine-5)-methyltransferase 1